MFFPKGKARFPDEPVKPEVCDICKRKVYAPYKHEMGKVFCSAECHHVWKVSEEFINLNKDDPD